MTFRAGQKPYLIKLATRQTIIGMALLLLAMNGAILLLTDFLFHTLTVGIAVGGMVTLYAWLWFGQALRRLAAGRTEW
jgi:hypothetical protein